MRRVEKQEKLVHGKRRVDEMRVERVRLRRIAGELHEVYKRYKAGIIKDSDLTVKQRELLRRYYGL